MPEGAAAPLPLSSAGRGVYPARRQFVSRLRSMPSALPIYRHRSSSSGDVGRGRRPFRFLPQAGVCTPLGNNLSPVCGQCRRRFRFIVAVPLPPGCRKGSPPPSALFRPLGNNLSPISSQCRRRFRFTVAVPLPPGCRKGPPPLPLFSAGGGVYPAEERFSVCQDATTCCPLPFHPFRKPLPKENRFRYAKPGARHSRVPGFVSLVQRGFILSARLLTGENLPPTQSAAASPSTESWSPRRFPTHNAHRGRSAPRTSCTSRPTAQPSPRQW